MPAAGLELTCVCTRYVARCDCRQPGIELVPFSSFQMIFHLCN